MGIFFDVLKNNSGLTEEYLYAHQPSSDAKIAVYSTSKDPVGYLDDSLSVREQFDVISGPAILVARKGYGGRLSVIRDVHFIVHEDGYAIRPKPKYNAGINLDWFAGHYTAEFQSNRSSVSGIGDFPRAKLWTMSVIIPKVGWQDECAKLYKRRDDILEFVKNAPKSMGESVDKVFAAIAAEASLNVVAA
jgi:hypothetical protein